MGRRLSRATMPSRTALPVPFIRQMATVTGGNALTELAIQRPHMDAVRYEHKNVKWTFRDVNYYADSLACGLLDMDLQPGDKILSWLPSHLAELHILQFACSKSGLILYTLDPYQAVADKEGAVASLAKALEITEANVLIQLEAGMDTNFITLLDQIVPEIGIFDFAEGIPFLTPRFPHLRLCVHTGFSDEDTPGMFPYKHMLIDSNDTAKRLEAKGFTLTANSPLLGELKTGTDGLPTLGKLMSNEEVQKSGVWPEYNSILAKQYLEVPGIGVIF